MLDPVPAASDQNPIRLPFLNAAGRLGAMAASGSVRPVASRIRARAICETGDASRKARSLLMRTASARCCRSVRAPIARVAR